MTIDSNSDEQQQLVRRMAEDWLDSNDEEYELEFEDRQFSLPFQTVLHALARGMTLKYVPIRCTPTRTGASKVSGQWRNSLKAAEQMGISFFRMR